MRRIISPKKELSPKALENLKKRIWDLPRLDRNCLLVMSVIDDQPEAYAASAGMCALACHMAENYSAENKMRLAEFLRSSADNLDHGIIEKKVICDVAHTQRD